MSTIKRALQASSDSWNGKIIATLQYIFKFSNVTNKEKKQQLLKVQQ